MKGFDGSGAKKNMFLTMCLYTSSTMAHARISKPKYGDLRLLDSYHWVTNFH